MASEMKEDASAPAGADLLVRVRALLPSLPPSEVRIARAVLADPGGVAALTIAALAARAGTSQASVVRFSRALGLRGYPDLRLGLAAETGRHEVGPRDLGSDIGPEDDLSEVVQKIAFADARAVEDTGAQLDVAALTRAVEALATARRIDVYGVAASGFVALDFQQKLHRIGRTAFAWADPHVALTSAALLGPDDVAVGVSHTGATIDTIDALTEAHRAGAMTVAITNFPRSAITEVADVVLTTAARETTFRSGAMSSRLAQLMVIDCLFVGVAQRTYDQTREALAVTAAAVSGRRVTGRRASERGRR